MTPLRAKITKLALLGLAVALLGLTFQAQRWVNAEREQLGLTRLKPLENAPPILAFTTVALGGFRGLIANALWIRANDLQEAGKHFEMVQLADWITKLQPHIPTVWYHLAWNMAYNISVKFQNPADRWMWVQRGIELLRDDALKYNPRAAILYRELSWLYQHKMGHNLDDAHMFYKRSWAREMEAVLGKGRPDWDGLITPQSDDARRRAQVLRDRYKLDPSVMKEIDERYGPFEWRLPEAHAVYWAFLGQRVANKEDQDKLARSIYQSMQTAFGRGAILESKSDTNFFALAPNLDIVPKASKSYEDMMAQEPSRTDIKTGHRNFLKRAVYHLYAFNRKREADKWFRYLKQQYPDALPADMSLDDYAIEQVSEDAGETNMDETAAVIRGLLFNAFVERAENEDDRANNYELMAQRVWRRFSEKTAKQKQRVGLPPYAELRQQTLDTILDPERGLSLPMQAALRTKLGLPPPTNAPPAATNIVAPR
jgi:hypothetical protein